jgi:hypothetical protein
MTVPAATKDAMLNALTFTQMSLHSAYPGTTGTNELTGGTPAYARKAITVSTSVSGVGRSLSASAVFDVAAGTTVRWLGFWNGGVFIDALPNGGATPKNFSVITATDQIVSTAHGYADGTAISFFGVPPTGLTEGTIYYTRDGLSSPDIFKVAASPGGAAIDLTGAASYGCIVIQIVERFYGSQDTHTVTAGQFLMPD